MHIILNHSPVIVLKVWRGR